MMDNSILNAASPNVAEIKCRAEGQWTSILSSICGLSHQQLNPSVHGPCPKCGGTDRFRAMDDVARTGALFCNQCFSKRNGDGFAAIQWYLECNFPRALQLVADAVGHVGTSHQTQGSSKATSQPEKPKKVHATKDAAVKAITWSFAKNGRIDKERKPDFPCTYQNGDGSEAGLVVRWNLPDGRKTFGQLTKVDGGWIVGGMPEPRPLLNLPEVIKAETVYVTEGEKAAVALLRIGVVPTTPSQGAKSPQLSDWSRLNGKRVVILPDNDKDGELFAVRVLQLIREQSPEATVEVKRLKDLWPEIPEKGDAFDWLQTVENIEPAVQQAQLEALPARTWEYHKPAADLVEKAKATPAIASFAGQTASELWPLADEPVKWMVENVFSLEQPTVIGARKKSLKTTLLSSLVVSLVTGYPWLGRFKIPQKFKVLFVTGEATKRAAIRKVRRAADALNLRAEDLSGLRIEAVNFPKFPRAEDLAAIAADIELHSIDIVVIDPLYRGMDASINAQNIFAMGDALGKFMDACSPASVILSHHVKKSAQFDKSELPDLDDLSQAGVAEFAGNYMLIGRLAKYEGDGQHDLAISFGGRDEQFSQYRLQFDERKFEGHLTGLKDHVAHKEQQAENRKVVEMLGKVVEELKALPDHQTSESSLAGLCSTKPNRQPFRDALKTLETRAVIVCLRDFKPPNSRACKGWKLVEPTSDKTTSDSVRGLV
jgi:hypothetical protein